ncbi:MAG: phasin family protein [Alphaproteobacteria bacterium]
MTQTKKTSSSKATAEKATKQAFDATESTRNSAEKVVHIGSNAVKDFLNTSAQEAQKVQDKALQISREGSEQFAKSADSMGKVFQELASLTRENAETCIECNNLTASFARDFSSEAFDTANRTFSEGMELSKEFLGCRTFNDMLEVQSRFFQSSMEKFFGQSSRLSSMLFEYGTEAMEPINERVASNTEKLQKVLAS